MFYSVFAVQNKRKCVRFMKRTSEINPVTSVKRDQTGWNIYYCNYLIYTDVLSVERKNTNISNQNTWCGLVYLYFCNCHGRSDWLSI